MFTWVHRHTSLNSTLGTEALAYEPIPPEGSPCRRVPIAGAAAMGDSSMSASELRNRYHQGGSAGDADLSASQLRARYGIASNRAGMCRRPSIVRLAIVRIAIVRIALY